MDYPNPPTEGAFNAMIKRAAARLAALDGDEAEIVAAAQAALFDMPATGDAEAVPGLTDSFGYNRGYMLQILEAPPEGIEASPEHRVNCGGLFDCVHATPKLAAPADLGGFQAVLNGGDPPDATLSPSCCRSRRRRSRGVAPCGAVGCRFRAGRSDGR